jgi:Domain of unknown function (DUF3783)
MEGKAKVLVYGFSGEEQRRIDDGLASLGVPPALKARPGQGGEALRQILAEEGPQAGDPGTETAAGGSDARERLVLFHNVSDAGVQALMRFFRGAVAGRPIFAVTTPTSIDWTLGQLLAHLVEERAALEGGR